MQTALELFFNDEGRYPTTVEFNAGSIYSTSTNSTTTYMAIIPSAPAPADGNCSTNGNTYVYEQRENGNNYSIDFCLGGQVASLTPDSKCATSNAIYNADCCSSIPVAYEGQTYNTVKIGTQCWFKENLKATKYNDGTDISNLTDPTEWTYDTGGAYAWYYNNYATYGSVYGALYNFYAVNPASNGGKNICPIGWHVPTDAEFTTLVEGQSTVGCEAIGSWACSPAGNKLKEAGAIHWDGSNAGTNSSGFTALGAGIRYDNGPFDAQGQYGWFWSSSVIGGVGAWMRALETDLSGVGRIPYGSLNWGLSVRCLKD
jgi:uncharacterized protein (TIGR02145 family)